MEIIYNIIYMYVTHLYITSFMSEKYNMEFMVPLDRQSWSSNITPRTWNYVDPEPSYDYLITEMGQYLKTKKLGKLAKISL